jgi:site-specific recombinase XerD
MTMVSALAEQFLTYLKESRHLSDNTLHSYRSDIALFRTFLQEENPPDMEQVLLTVDREKIVDYVARLETQGYSRSSISRMISTIRSLYKWMRRTELITVLPLERFTWKKGPTPPPSTIPFEQLEKFLAMPNEQKFSGARDAAMLHLLCATGIRISELVVLTVGSIDTTSTPPLIRIGGRKKRSVGINDKAFKKVQAYITRCNPVDTGSILFTNKNGKKLSSRTVSRIITRYLAEAGINPTINSYSLRHTYVKQLIANGMQVEDVRKILGNSSSPSVLRTYFKKIQPASP